MVAVTMVPSSHPPVIVDKNREPFFIDGRFHISVPESTWRTSKSQAPNAGRLNQQQWNGNRVQIGIASDWSGTQISALTKRVRHLALNALAETFLQL